MREPARIYCLTLAFFVLTALAAGAPAVAEHHESGYLGDFSNDFEAVSKKLVDLAEAIPADKFAWRPTEEVRTVSESLIHVATANYFLSQALGVSAPEGAGPDMEKSITAKAEVLAELKQSQDHVRKAIEAAGADLEKEVELFGNKRSTRGVFMIMAGHSHEHLGQLIAYARSVGVVPPWSRPAAQ